LLRVKVDITEKFIKRFKGYSFDKIIFKANEIALVQSRLAQGGSIYNDLKTYELK
jgi:2'-5' RNA ligase